MLRVSTSLSSTVKWAKERLSHVDRCTLPSLHGHCPCCWRPLQCELLDDGKLRDESSSTCGRAAKRAYVVAVWGSSLDYAIGAVPLGQSLDATGTEHDLVCLHTADVPEWPHLYILRRFWQLRAVPYLEPVPDLFYGDKDTSRFRYVFIKLHMMSLTEYDKIVFLDTDTLVLQSIDDLFELPAPAAMRRGMNVTAAQLHGSPIDGSFFFATDENSEWAWGQGTGINAGVMLVAPDWNTYQRMLSEVRCHNHPAHVGGTGPEQDYFSRFWADAPWTHICAEYNFQLHQLYNALVRGVLKMLSAHYH